MNAQNFPPNAAAAMRHMRPGAPFNQFGESPAGTPPYPHVSPAAFTIAQRSLQNPMMPNGSVMCSAPSMMTSPAGVNGPPPPGALKPDGTPVHDPRFMAMVSQQQQQFAMGHPPPHQQQHEGGTPGLNGQQPGMEGGPSQQQQPQFQSLLNGGGDGAEMKHSPASVHGGVSMVNGGGGGGTPGGASHTNPGSIQGGPSSGEPPALPYFYGLQAVTARAPCTVKVGQAPTLTSTSSSSSSNVRRPAAARRPPATWSSSRPAASPRLPTPATYASLWDGLPNYAFRKPLR